VSDAPDYDRTPWWGWLIMVAAAAMFIGLIVTALKSGGG
jgi:hypothetical protein